MYYICNNQDVQMTSNLPYTSLYPQIKYMSYIIIKYRQQTVTTIY